MASNVEEIVIEKIRALSTRQQETVLEFVDSLSSRAARVPESRKTIWETIRDIVSDVPDDAWNELPTDGSEQHDHYLYGTPKK